MMVGLKEAQGALERRTTRGDLGAFQYTGCTGLQARGEGVCLRFRELPLSGKLGKRHGLLRPGSSRTTFSRTCGIPAKKQAKVGADVGT